MSKRKEENKKLLEEEIALSAVDIINKYGTYNIQPTAATPNAFPKIAQGLPKTDKADNKYPPA